MVMTIVKLIEYLERNLGINSIALMPSPIERQVIRLVFDGGND